MDGRSQGTSRLQAAEGSVEDSADGVASELENVTASIHSRLPGAFYLG